MSSSTHLQNYQFTLIVDMQQVTFTYTSAGEMSDEMAIAFKNAWKALPWPTGHQIDAQVQRQDYTLVQYYEDDTTNPPSFT